jgi:methionyl-tRNA formyltransferase
MIRVGLFGCKQTSRFMIENLDLPLCGLVTIDPELGAKFDVADYCDLRSVAAARGLACYNAKTYALSKEEDVSAIAAMKFNVAFVIGWQRLIPAQVLGTIPKGVYGMHGSSMDLPRGRGRSPMNWSIIEGRNTFRTNLFRYDPGVDSGDIAASAAFSIRESDTAETLHFKNMLSMKYLIGKHYQDIALGRVALQQQAQIAPTYYPKRTPADGLIDWTRDVAFVARFIRAVTRPFAGAFTFAGTTKTVIYRAEVFEDELVDLGYRAAANGTVVELLPNHKALVKCEGGLLILHEYTGELARGTVLGNGSETLHVFPTNAQGGFDMPES